MAKDNKLTKDGMGKIRDHLYAIWSADDMNKGEFEYRTHQIQSLIDKKVVEARIEELEHIVDNFWEDDTPDSAISIDERIGDEA